MKSTLNYHNNMLGYFGEPKAAAYLAKSISFYSKLFLSPFNVAWRECHKSYKLVPVNLIPKMLSVLFVFGNIISFLYWVAASIQELEEFSKSDEDGTITVGLLVLTGLFLTWLSIGTAIVTIWIRQEEIIALLQCLEDSLDVLHIPSVLVWLCPLLFYVASSVTNLYSTTGQVTVLKGSEMVTNGIVCILQRLGVISLKFGEAGVSRIVVDCIRTFFKVIIFHGGCFSSMPHTLLLTLSLGLRQIGKEVERTMKDVISVNEGLRVYERLKRITKKTNSVFGSVIFTHYLCNLTYAIQTPFLVSATMQTVEVIHYLLWLFVSALIWWVGSEFHRLCHDAFRSWIQTSLGREMAMDDRLKMSILSNMIDKDAIGLYCRYFTVTHRFLTTTCGAVITYGIIVLQVQNAAN